MNFQTLFNKFHAARLDIERLKKDISKFSSADFTQADLQWWSLCLEKLEKQFEERPELTDTMLLLKAQGTLAKTSTLLDLPSGLTDRRTNELSSAPEVKMSYFRAITSHINLQLCSEQCTSYIIETGFCLEIVSRGVNNTAEAYNYNGHFGERKILPL